MDAGPLGVSVVFVPMHVQPTLTGTGSVWGFLLVPCTATWVVSPEGSSDPLHPRKVELSPEFHRLVSAQFKHRIFFPES